MAGDFAKQFYASKAWAKCRNAYRKKARGLCERCLKQGIYSPGQIVHHKIHLTPDNITDPNIALSFDNLELLCRECHQREHSKQQRYRIEPDGSLTILPHFKN